MSDARRFDPIDISTLAFWAKPPAERDLAFAELRQERPISWHPPAEAVTMPADASDGFWALTRHADIVSASRNDAFASGADLGGMLIQDSDPAILESTASILAMDNPRHQKLRRIISSVFTPPRIARIEGQIRNQARLVVDAVAPRGEIDFVRDVSSRLPMWTISEMIGIDEADRETVATCANALVASNDPEFAAPDGVDPLTFILTSVITLHETAFALVEKRRSAPADDLITALCQAEVDGERLTDEEIAAFFLLLCVAGNDTTRHSTSGAMLAFQAFPAQRAALMADFEGRIGPAVDELLRFVSPILTFRRTARYDTDVNGHPVTAGERVVLFYRSGNFDTGAFDDPLRLDLARKPNPHVSFGGGGPHYCLGVHLAKTQMRSILRELLTRLPDIELGEPEYVVTYLVNGIKRMPATFTPAG